MQWLRPEGAEVAFQKRRSSELTLELEPTGDDVTLWVLLQRRKACRKVGTNTPPKRNISGLKFCERQQAGACLLLLSLVVLLQLYCCLCLL